MWCVVGGRDSVLSVKSRLQVLSVLTQPTKVHHMTIPLAVSLSKHAVSTSQPTTSTRYKKPVSTHDDQVQLAGDDLQSRDHRKYLQKNPHLIPKIRVTAWM
jgi:hypothetical protein